MLDEYQAALEAHFAPLFDLDRWWPGRSRFEVVVSAILVQNTAWTNAAHALDRLRRAGRLSLRGMRALDAAALGELIRCSGCWRQKSRRLLGFIAWLDARHGGSLGRLFAQPTAVARTQLLALDGIGEETADTILLFAGDHGAWIMDAYTRRIFSRHGLPIERAWVERHLPPQPRARRRFHAVLVETAKQYCRKHRPDCASCPLRGQLPA